MALAFVLLFLCPVILAAQQTVPPLTKRVTDRTNSLNSSEETSLEALLTDLESRSGAQLAVLLIASTQPETIEQYSLRVAEQWKLGSKNKDNGLLLVVALEDHAARFEVGYGLEGTLPDVIAKRIIEEKMIPAFKEGNVPLGIRNGVTAAIAVLLHDESQFSLEPNNGYHPSTSRADENIPIIVIVSALFGGLLKTIFKPALAGLIVAGLAFTVTYWTISSLALAFGVALFVFLLVLVNALGGGRSFGGRGGYRGGYGGGGFSGGGGGFSGGGGSFGGGGASGRW